MEVYKIKATLQRSNPALIREFTVPEDMELARVGETLQLLLGWKELSACSFRGKTAAVSSKKKVKEALPAEGVLFCTLPNHRKGELGWEFRLKLLGTAKQEEDFPKVIRSRGENLPKDTDGSCQFNLLQQNWNGSARVYFNSFCNEHPMEKFRFNRTNAERALRRKFSASSAQAGSQPPELDYANAFDFKDFYGRDSKERIYNIGKILGLPVSGAFRKAELLSYVAGQMGRKETLNELLQFLTLNQYRAFRKICAGQGSRREKGAMKETILLLELRGYIEGSYSIYTDGAPRCTRELLDAYGEWLDAADEPAYLRLALLRSSLVACVRLLGCIGKDSWKSLAPKSTKKTYTQEELDSAWWAVWSHSASENLLPGNENLIYCRDKLKPREAEQAAALLAGRELYAPTIAEIRQLEGEGLLYPEPKGGELEKFLQTECRMDKNQSHQSHRNIYESLKSGIDPDEYTRWAAPKLGISGRVKTERLKLLIRELSRITRKPMYGGFTQQEMERMK